MVNRPLPRPGPSGAIDRCSRRPTKRRWPCRRANRPSRRKAVARPTDENGRSRAFLRSRVARNNGPFLGEHSFSHSRIGPLGPDRRAHLLTLYCRGFPLLHSVNRSPDIVP